jgi:hypothetical protein
MTIKSLHMLQLYTTHINKYKCTLLQQQQQKQHNTEPSLEHFCSRLYSLDCAHKDPYQLMIQESLVLQSCQCNIDSFMNPRPAVAIKVTKFKITLGFNVFLDRIVFTVVPCILILSKFFIYQLIHKRIALRRIIKCTLKQLLHVSAQTP